uniref:Uncharacterized protein n=2 Tax=Cacopsylla melanoneura TaxID=428564 RepID=A0A8D8Y6P6_9HEMI
MGRLIRTKIPISKANLQPIENLGNFHNSIQNKLKSSQQSDKHYYNKGTKSEKEFEVGNNILLRENNKWVSAQIHSQTPYPRSYNVLRQDGSTVRRNSTVIKRTVIPFKESGQNNFDEILENKIRNKNTNNIDLVLENNVNQENTVLYIENSTEEPHPHISNNNQSNHIEINETLAEEHSFDETVLDVAMLEGSESESENGEGFHSAVGTPLKSGHHDHDHDYLKRTKSGRIVVKPLKLNLYLIIFD